MTWPFGSDSQGLLQVVLPIERNGGETEWALELVSSKELLSECIGLHYEVQATGMNWTLKSLFSRKSTI